MDLQLLYSRRFSCQNLAHKNSVWKVICDAFLSRHIRPTDTVVDVGAGYCEFINNIRCARKIAVDINPDVKRFADPSVQVINESCTAIGTLESDSVDVVFMSNFLEHLPNKQLILETFREAYRILKKHGHIIILQPNIRFVPGEYWDFFDHHIPLTDRSLCEALVLEKFEIEQSIARFLPYTTKSVLPQAPWLVRLYLKVPLLWRILGAQALVIGVKP